MHLSSGEPRWPDGSKGWQDALARAGTMADAVAAAQGGFAVSEPLSGNRTFMAVDRFSQQTLCWRMEGEQLRVADRADTLGGTDIDPQAIHDYLFFHAIPSPRTIYRSVNRIPAGHFALANGADVQVSRYNALRFTPQPKASFESLKREFRGLMTDAVQRELGSGMPACFLSGGTDSSTVAGHIKQLAGEVHTYSIGFEAEGYDEMAYARIVAKHFGAVHHEYYVTPNDLVQHIPLVAGAYDQPFGNSSALPAFCCALRAREDGVSKLLAGDGGDELFGGNTRYATQKVFNHWDRVPRALRQGLIEPVLGLPGADRVALLRKGQNYMRAAKAGLPARLHAYNLLTRLGEAHVLEPAFLKTLDPQSVAKQTNHVWGLADAQHDLDRMLAYDWRYTLAESDLPKVRGTSALAGLQVGYPMLDDALVAFSMRLPEDFKVRGQQLRWFFKEALRDFLPEAVLTKEKKGFGLPFGVWANQHAGLKALASDSLQSFATRGVVRPAFIKELLEQRLPEHPGYYGEMVWILMMFEQWLRRHAPDWRFRSV